MVNRAKRLLLKYILRGKINKTDKIQGSNNIICIDGNRSSLDIEISGDENIINVAMGAYIENTKIFINGSKHRLKIDSGIRISNSVIWFEDQSCTITVGKNTSIESAHLAVTESHRKIIIGEDCMISTDVQIRTGDSHSIIDMRSGKRINNAQDVIIEDHVWLGANTMILKGAHICSNSIVAAGAIVTSTIPPNCIAAGAPARIIKEGVDWLRERV